MTVSRRGFLFALGATGWSLANGESLPTGAPELRFGVLSDSHISVDPTTHEAIRREFKFFAKNNVDAVCHAGDIVEVGNFDELNAFVQLWNEAFPGGNNASGKKVTPIFAFGNHDYHAGSKYRNQVLSDEEKRNFILHDKNRAWRMLTGEDFSGKVYSKTVNGYTFVATHWSYEDRIADWFKANPSDATKPIFHIRHPHPPATCFGSWAHGVTKGVDELKKHPELMVMSGHSHINVGNDCGLWQGGFVSMGCGSARMTSLGAFGGIYDNMPSKQANGGKYHTKSSPGKAWQASIVSVYPKQIVVERYDFSFEAGGEAIGEPWLVDFPFRHNSSAPYMIAAEARAPRFANGVKFDFVKAKGVCRPEKVDEEQLQIVLSEGAKSDGPHSRPGSYRFEIIAVDGNRKLFERSVVQEWWGNCERRSAARKVMCAFGLEELPKGVPFCVKVTPMNAAGKQGDAIVSSAYSL